jgi:uncharacterized protein (TIGR03435 family)
MKAFALLFALTSLLAAQEFEVASIRPARDDGDHDSDVQQGRFVAHNRTLKRLIAMAWNVDDGAVTGGPGWADSEGYDINAKIPAEYPKWTPEQFSHMMQALLADRFRLAIHRETRQVPGYALVTARNGPKLAPAKPADNGSDFSSHNLHLKATNVTMELLARRLSRDRDIAKIVVDRTGLKGTFDFELDWAPAQAESADHPAIFTAIQEQLGLRLESAKVPIEAVVIDRVERPSDN